MGRRNWSIRLIKKGSWSRKVFWSRNSFFIEFGQVCWSLIKNLFKKTFPAREARRGKLRYLDPKSVGNTVKWSTSGARSAPREKLTILAQNHGNFFMGLRACPSWLIQKTFSQRKSFFYSYSWRSEKLIIDLKNFISIQRYVSYAALRAEGG